jgi:membrane protease YdiL (CAAX protease family)
MEQKSDSRIFLILVIIGAIGYFAGLPYLLELSGATYAPIVGLLIGGAINVAILAAMIFVGLRLGKSVGLGAPIIEDGLRRQPIGEKLKEILKYAPILGIISAVLIFVLDLFVFAPLISGGSGSGVIPTLGSRFLAMFYGGIYEELFLRLFVLTVIIWIVWKIKHNEDGTPFDWTFWLGIIISAIIFGLLHLPATALIMEITPIVIIRGLVLNGLPGVIFGWLYWKQGIESSMVSHIFTDLTLHVILLELLMMLMI